MRVVAVTHPGFHRVENQDRIVVDGVVLASGVAEPVALGLGHRCLLAVIDGMGGHPAGGVAAAIVADMMASGHQQIRTAADVEALVSAANDEVYGMMARIPALSGMGATIAGLAAIGDELVVFNVGDARVYLAAGGHLMQASVDDRRPGATQGAITQSLGGLHSHTTVDVHVSCEQAEPGRVLVASDGLFDGIEHEAMTRAMVASLDEAARVLLEQALAAGGTDNISFALLELPEDPASEPDHGVVPAAPMPTPPPAR